MTTPTLKSNAGDQKVCKKQNISHVCLVRIENSVPLDHCFGITRQSLVIPNSDRRTDFSIRIIPMKDSYILLEECIYGSIITMHLEDFNANVMRKYCAKQIPT